MEDYDNIRLPWQDWKIVKYLGGGAYGKVYEIERNIAGIQEKAALKIISRPKDSGEIDAYYDNGYDKESIVASYQSEIQSCVKEYQLMKELEGQSNIVSCDDFTVIPNQNGIGGNVFIRMELLTSVQQVLRERTLSIDEIIKLGRDISHALILCESKNIVHRDIKPTNIMVSQFGDFKLGDFGVSKTMDHSTFATAMGTPEYQAPEVVHMEKYGNTADIYSLGITMYWLLNNRKMPFIGADEKLTPMVKSAAMEKRYRGDRLSAPKNGSKALKEIVLKACEYRPQDRYASAKELYEALDALQTGRDSQTSEASKNSSRQENQTVQPEETYSTVIATTLNGQTASNRETAYNGQTSYNGPEESNSWGASVGTIGNPGGKLYNNDGKSTDFITETMGKQEVVQKKNIDKKQDETDELLKKIDVFKSVPWWSRLGFGIGIILCFLGVMCIRSKEDFDISLVCILIGLPVCLLCVWIIHFAVWEIILEILLLCGGSYLFISGLMSAQIITYLGVAGLFILGPSNFIKWMYQNKKKIADFDDLIKTNPEFAKRLYYEKCPQKNLVKYIEKLNSTVAREIKVSPK